MDRLACEGHSPIDSYPLWIIVGQYFAQEPANYIFSFQACESLKGPG